MIRPGARVVAVAVACMSAGLLCARATGMPVIVAFLVQWPAVVAMAVIRAKRQPRPRRGIEDGCRTSPRLGSGHVDDPSQTTAGPCILPS